jgi:hypothetical protein
VAYELWVVLFECGRAEDVVGVDVGHHHVLDRELGFLANGGAQTLAVNAASARVDDRHGVTPDDEADVGYGVGVFGRRVFIHAASHVDARRHFLCRPRSRVSPRLRTDAEIARARD